MFDNIASIDIGSSSIKIVKIKRGFRNFEVVSLIHEEIDPDAAEKDYNSAIGELFTKILMVNDLSDCRIVMSSSSEKLTIRNLSFPFSDLTNIANAIPFEVEDKIPFPISSASYDFQAFPENEDGGRSVLLAAVNKEIIADRVNFFNEHGLFPVYSGLESNGLFRCYEYFNTVNDENIIQIDIGCSKSIINIVKNNTLSFTRVIPAGIGMIVTLISESIKCPRSEALNILKSLDVDLSSKDLNTKNTAYKDSGITKTLYKAICNETKNLFMEICNEVIVTINSDNPSNNPDHFSRVILSGGGSNVKGVSGLISDLLNMPALFMPFLESYNDENIKSRFPICFGNLLVYLNHKDESINLLKGDFLPEGADGILKQYRLPVFFTSAALVILIFNFLITFFLVSKSSNYYEDILKNRYMKFFNVQNAPDDPLEEGIKKLNLIKKELSAIKTVTGEKDSFMIMIGSVVKSFPDPAGFDLKRITYDGSTIVIEGEIRSSADLEIFRNQLHKSGLFESISSDIRDSSTVRSLFTMTIKRKI